MPLSVATTGCSPVALGSYLNGSLKHALLNEAHIQQVKQQNKSQTLVILPIGTLSFYPDSGFREKAEAILVLGEIGKHTIDQKNLTSVRQDSQVDALK